MGDAVAEAVLAQFAALPKTGKPQPHEHTVLAGIALTLPPASHSGGGPQQPAGDQLAVAALATGTKCLGAGRRVPGGGALNDCHAEALSRRALLRWLYAEMRHAADQCADALRSGDAVPCSLDAAASAASTRVLQLVPPRREGGSAAAAADDLCGGWRFRLQPGVQLHMYVSQPPCGDASILEAACQADGQPHAGEAGAAATAGCRFGRTGAKPLRQPAPEVSAGQAPLASTPLPLPQQHDVESYAEAQAAGVVRRKPGRGDATLSVSCSDKLARWCLLGLQGSLLAGVLEPPLHLASVTVSLPLAPADPSEAAAGPAAAPATKEEEAAAAALRRALLERTAGLAVEGLPPGFQQASLALHIHRQGRPAAGAAPGLGGDWAADLGLAPTSDRKVPSGCSLVWRAPPSSAFKWKAGPGGVAVLRGGTSEGVVGMNGLRAGSKKLPPEQPAPPAAQTTLCKAALFAQWQALAASLGQLCVLGGTQQAADGGDSLQVAALRLPQGMTYRQAKCAACPAYGDAWARLRQPPSPLHGWIPKPPGLEEFALQLPPRDGSSPASSASEDRP